MHTINGIGNIQNGIINLQGEIQSHTLSELKDILQDIRLQLVDEAQKYIGYPSHGYKGPDKGIDEKGFDCSGFIKFILNKFGLSQPDIRHVNEYFDSYGINIHREFIQPGDLIFFSKDGLVPKHIGILISDTEYIHAPGKANTFVEIQKIEDQIIEKSAPGKIYTHNPIGFKRVVLELNKDKFDFNGSNRKRRGKIV